MTSTTKIIGAADAQRMLDDGRWEYDDSAADCARSVIDLHRQVDTARSVAANIERERSALREAYYRDTAGLRAEVRVIVDERAAWRDRVEARDEVAERLTAELSTATGEIARLRAALAEVHREVAKLRSFMPIEAVAVCPSCGGGVVADLDDDWEYIMRRHHRGVAGDGLSLVLCDGGIAREGTRYVC